MAANATALMVFLVLSAGLSGGAGAILWRRRSAPGTTAAAVVLVLMAGWSLMYAGVVASPELEAKLRFQMVAHVSQFLTPVPLLVFAAQYTGQARWLTRGRVLALAVVPVAAILLAWTNPLHEWLWTGARLDPEAGAARMTREWGVAWHGFVLYDVALALGAVLLLGQTFLSAPRLYRRQTIALVVAIALPIAANVLWALNVLPVGNTRLSLFVMPLSTSVLALGLYRYRLFDAAPVAYRTVVAGMADAVLVLDGAGRVVDLNPAAAQLVGRPVGEALGERVEALLPGPLAAALDGESGPGAGDEVRVETEGGLRYLDVLPSSLRVADETRGRVVVLRDATDRTLRRENERLVGELERNVAALEESRRRVTAAEERLRREIAELLHTRVQGRLLLAWLRLGELEASVEAESGARQLVAEVRADLEDVREREVRAASHMLHPSVIRMGLTPALEALADRYEERGLAMVVAADERLVQLDRPRDGLSEALRLGAYRVVEEALSNVVRHAGATRVEINLSLDESGARLVVAVRDDGRGFDAAAIEPGLGLASIAARVDQLGGTWEIDGRPGAGTSLTFSLPLPEDGRRRANESLTGAPSALGGFEQAHERVG